MLLLLFETALFKFRAKAPALEVLFQLPPTMAGPAGNGHDWNYSNLAE